MKKQIVCMNCNNEHGGILLRLARKDNAFFRSIIGLARRPFICDRCDADVAPGDRCFAWSMAPNDRDYEPWEMEFLEQVP